METNKQRNKFLLLPGNSSHYLCTQLIDQVLLVPVHVTACQPTSRRTIQCWLCCDACLTVQELVERPEIFRRHMYSKICCLYWTVSWILGVYKSASNRGRHWDRRCISATCPSCMPVGTEKHMLTSRCGRRKSCTGTILTHCCRSRVWTEWIDTLIVKLVNPVFLMTNLWNMEIVVSLLFSWHVPWKVLLGRVCMLSMASYAKLSQITGTQLTIIERKLWITKEQVR